MGSESASASHDNRDSDDDDESEEAGGGSRLLGFMFGNVDNSGKLEVDYLTEEAKDNLNALADKLGTSIINLSEKSPSTPAAVEDYDEKAEDAVDYEDIEEQYEGPEVEAATEEDHLVAKSGFSSIDASATALGSSVFDDENYDEDEDVDEDKISEAVVNECPAPVPALAPVPAPAPTALILNTTVGDKTQLTDNISVNQETAVLAVGDKTDLAENISVNQEIAASAAGVKTELAENIFVNQEIAASVKQPENDVAVFDGGMPCVDQNKYSSGFANLLEEEPPTSDEVVDLKSVASLPVLYVENGMAVLRFSEIFGVNEPLNKTGRREHKPSISKDKYAALDASLMVEESEEAILKGSWQVFSTKKPSEEAQAKTFLDDDSEFDKFDSFGGMCALPDESKDSCLSAEPMRKDSVFDYSVEWQSCLSTEFYSLDQQDWEDKIVWGNSPVVSEISVESCELSEHDSEGAAHGKQESSSKPDYLLPDCKKITDEKDGRNLIAPSAFWVESFDSRDSGSDSNTRCSESRQHPQLLRLESRLVASPSNHPVRKEPVSEEQKDPDFAKRFKQLTLQNKDLVEGSWVENIIWDSKKPFSKSKLILDLQDEHMVFEILDNKDYEHLQAHAGALITACAGKVSANTLELPGFVAFSGGQFNISNDKYYSDRRTSPQLKSLSKKRAAHGAKILHSAPALSLQTMKPRLSNKELANFHRPKALWYPHDNEVALKELEKLSKQGPMKILIKSLGGKGIKFYVDAEDTVSSLKAKASKKFDFGLSEAVKLYHLGRELEDVKTLAELSVQPNSLLHLVCTQIHVLPKAQKLPNEKKSLRPPGAFKKKYDLSAKDGHIFLMEYCEERPLLLGNAGMCARLYTYYQKSSSDDQNGDMLRNSNSGLGTVVALDTADKSPFLGEIKSGSSQSSLETEMYKAPVFPHKVASTDYLLVRSAKGKLSLRRIDKIHVVGQQEPLMEVMSPGSKNPQNYLWNRLFVFMYREFRAAIKRNLPPCIRADELISQFPNIPEHFLRKRLKHCADLQRGPNGRLHWVMGRKFRIPPDEELRKMVKPETVCSYESMQAGLYRLKRLGILRLAHLTTPTQLSALSSAMNQLPDEAITLAAASHIEREMQITPWNLSANFVACIGQDKGNVERLEISGVGDPSGRGLGFSYTRVASKPPVSNALAKKKLVVPRGSTVTGTDADLRRLSMEAAREVLAKFNIPEEQIEELSRWHRIALIRKLSSEQAESGVEVDPSTISKYARGQRMSFLQLQQRSREKCQDIWDRQIQSLSAVDNENESDSEANSDLDSFAGDLENLLDAEEGEEGDEGALEVKNCKSDGVKGLKVRRHPPQARPEEQMEDEKLEAAELRRIILEGDGAKWKKKKKKVRPSGEATGPIQGPQRILVVENTPQVKRPITLVKQPDGMAVTGTPNDVLIPKSNDDLEVENLLSSKLFAKKVKAGKKNELLPVDLLNKKVKIMTEGIVDIHSRKSARESFVCGACGQLGHMRTNKNCPKYREDPDAQMSNMDGEHEAPKPIPQDSSQSQQRDSAVKLIPKSVSNISQVDGPEEGKSTVKTKVLKVRYATADKVSDKAAIVPEINSDQPSTSHAEVGNKSVPKVIKIVGNKKKPDDAQTESQKLNVVIRPPSETSRDPPLKRITIKQPRKDELINLDQTSEEGVDFEYRKTKKMTDLAVYSSTRPESILLDEEEVMRNNQMARRMWEEEEKRRNAEHARRMQEEHERLADLRRYEEAIRSEKEEEERQKANKKFKKKRTSDLRDDFYDEFQPKRNNRTLPGRNRSAKRKTVVEYERYGAEYAPPVKRRKGGEVGLANILEEILDVLKARVEISFLFQKPVSKKEAPDYLDIIERPMDLSTMKEKIRRLEYRSRDEFRHDVWQITYNAHMYNDGRNPGIPPLADQLLEISDYLLDQQADRLDEAEASIRDN
ncbi:hypothetical protein vseg_014876 [Gypsophila vaccaria]